MKRLILNSSGFTLIELIVAFTVMSVLSVVGVASFVDYSKSQAISADRQKLVTVLNTAKANASSQVKKNSNCIGDGVLNGYSVNIITTKSYIIKIECTPQEASASFSETYLLSNSVSIDSSGTNVAKIFFPLFSGKAELYSDIFGTVPVSPGSITLTGNGKTSTITIDQNGIIK